MADVRTGDGWAAASIEDLGEGAGFRKIRPALGVEAFGVNAVVLPPGYESAPHYHDRQEELYLVLEGEIEFALGEGEDAEERITLGPHGLVRVAARTVRRLRNTSPEREALYFCVGGAGGYVGRDGRRPGGPAVERAG